MSEQANSLLAGVIAQAIAQPEEFADTEAYDQLDQRQFAHQAVHAGFRLHSQQRPGEGDQLTGFLAEINDADTALLAGDRLYAFALERLSQQADLAAISQLANTLAQATSLVVKGEIDAASQLWDKPRKSFHQTSQSDSS